MSGLKQQFSYLRGFVDGLKFHPETKEGEILLKLLSFLEDATQHIDRLNMETAQSKKAFERVQGDVEEIKNELFPASDSPYNVTCPDCGQKSVIPPQEIKDKREVRCSLCENIIFLKP